MNRSNSPLRHGGRILADQLVLNNVSRVYSVPGESYLALLDGLLDTDIQNVVCRHEGGASMMAEASGKMTGAPGVALVTRGPGATNAACGVHVAHHDSTPMLLLVGQVARPHLGREAFQEIDIPRTFNPLAKWTAEIHETERIPEYISRAFQTAMSGRPGPVVLSLPEDMLHEIQTVSNANPVTLARQEISNETAAAVAKRIADSEQPIAIVGGSIWSDTTAADLAAVSERFDLPVVSSFRRQHYFDNRHPNYVGDLSPGANPKLISAIQKSDCVLLLGGRLSDMSSQGYTVPGTPAEARLAVHIHPASQELGKLWTADLAVAAAPGTLLACLVSERPKRCERRAAWLDSCRQMHSLWRQPTRLPGQVQFSQIIQWLSENLPNDSIITNGAGNYSAFLHRYFIFKEFGTQIASTSGSMGYGLPAAIAAKLTYPNRTVVCFAGDGCFQMTLNEMATAIQHKANVICIIANNGTYGTIRMHQESNFPNRVSGTELINPDFAALARSFGGHGETVKHTEDFPNAFRRAAAADCPSVIDIHLDKAAISTTRTLDEVRSQKGAATT